LKKRGSWITTSLLTGGAGILFLVFVLNCSGVPPFVFVLSLFGLGCISDQGTVKALAFLLFGLWVVVLGVPVLVSKTSST